MKPIFPALMSLLLCVAPLSAAIKTQVIEYKQGDTVLEGFLAYDDATNAKRPVVIVVHEWWGNNDYSRQRAQMVAQLGYVGFAIDMFGKGKITTQVPQAQEWSTQLKTDTKTAVARMQAAMDTLKNQPMTDMNRIASIGYCFGGTMSLNMARNNMPVLGVVSFHGDLTPATAPASAIKPKVLVCHGAEDPFVPPPTVQAFMDEMRKSSADWQLIHYSGAVHSFTNPGIDKVGLAGAAYNKAADERSWEAMKVFLSSLFKG